MKKSELIKKLQNISEIDYEVCVADWGKNLAHASDDTCGVGMYDNISISLEENANKEAEHTLFIALSIENDDYDDSGVSIKNQLIKALEQIATGEIINEPKNFKDSLAIIKKIAEEALALVYEN